MKNFLVSILVFLSMIVMMTYQSLIKSYFISYFTGWCLNMQFEYSVTNSLFKLLLNIVKDTFLFQIVLHMCTLFYKLVTYSKVKSTQIYIDSQKKRTGTILTPFLSYWECSDHNCEGKNSIPLPKSFMCIYTFFLII